MSKQGEEIMKEVKASKVKRDITIKLSTIIIVVVSLSIGAVIGIVSNNTINSIVDHQVQSKIHSLSK